MSETRRFAIRRSFLLPLGLLLVLCLALFFIVIAKGEPTGKIIILGCIILPVAILFLESAFRQAIVDDEGITVKKFLRRKELRFAEVTSVDTVLVRRRAFLTLGAEDDFLILSNAYADFPALVKELLARVPTPTVSAETQQMAAAPPNKSTDIVSCWLAVALMAFILFIQLGGRF
ncbi:MAG: PH domain-containing protein [Desulfuromonadales bacterium]